MKILKTTSEVMDALGGNQAVSKLTGCTAQAVSNWRRFDSFPSNTFVAMTGALAMSGQFAPASLWGMRAADARQTR
jgi:hypothetical protein